MLANLGWIGYILRVMIGARPQFADVVLRRGRVHGRVEAQPTGTAIAVGGGSILAVGGDAEIDALVGPATDVWELDGASVLPGFIDSHTHFHRAAIVRRLHLDFETLAPASVQEILEHVRARARSSSPDAWIQGDSLSLSRLAEGRLPVREELDAAAGGRRVVLRGIGKHVVAASSAALAAAGIDASTPDPPGGRIERDAAGTPTGILHERAKLRLDASHPDTIIPPTTREERLAALREAFGDLHRLGITTIHEMIRLPEEADDLAALHAAGELPVRVRTFYRVHETPIDLDDLAHLGIRAGFGDDWFGVLGIKISVDGWCIFRNAAVEEPYLDDPANRGLMRIEPALLGELVGRANDRGLAIALHAVGPRAVDAALDAFEAAGPASARPYRLEHGHLDMDERRLRRIADLGVVWSVQPALLPAYRLDWEASLGRERTNGILPLAAGLRLGIPLLLNSDVPSGPQDPIGAIRAAVTRRAGGGTIGADQGIPLDVAWRGWTTSPAQVAGDGHLGCLEPGGAADMIVVSRDPFVGTIDDEPPIAVMATMVGGRFVYEDGSWA
ncbi:MAG TPA: amidohydrolase [Candidatus Limnocylindrales bacterium]